MQSCYYRYCRVNEKGKYMMNLKNTKSQLAKLMATENITVQHKNAETACFDVKNRVLTLPILKDDLSVNIYDLMTSHEVGHALWTPEDGWHDAVCDNGPKFKTFLNIVEDARIEKKIKIKYPGLAGAYRNGYKELLDMNFFGLEGVDITKLPLIDRINLHFKLGTLVNLKFEGEEAEWVEKIAQTETFEEVMALTEELFASEKQKAEEQLEEEAAEEKAQLGQDEDDQEETAETDGAGDETDEQDDSNANGTAGDSDEFGDETGAGASEDWDEEFDDEEIDEMPVDAEELMGGDTDENQRNNEGRLTKNNGRETKYFILGDDDYSEQVIGYKKVLGWFANQPADQTVQKEIAEKTKTWKASNQKIVNYMVKEFEMRKKADEFKRARVAKTGELDMQKVFGYKFNDDLFKKVTTVQGGKNHGFVMYIDWSGSMAPNMSATIDQLLNLVTFCRKVKIPFEAYSFTDQISRGALFGENREPKNKPTMKDGMLIANEGRMAALVNLFDSNMSLSDFNKQMENMMMVRECLSNGRYYRFQLPRQMELGGTPLDSALVAAPTVLKAFKKKTKAQIVNFVVLSDGESHSTGVYDAEREYATDAFVSYRYDAFLQDDVTKKTYKIDGNTLTSSLIKAIGDRCDVNTIGFFIVENRARDIRSAFSRFGIYTTDLKEFRKNKFVEVTTAGYDAYYLLPGGTDLITGSDEGLDVAADASKAKIRSAFMKASNAKTANRVLLNRLMEKVAA